jgi:hypothetical protein
MSSAGRLLPFSPHNLRIACINRMHQSQCSNFATPFGLRIFDTWFVFRLRVLTIGILIPGSKLTLTELTLQVRFPCRCSSFARRKSNPSHVAPNARCVFTLCCSFGPCERPVHVSYKRRRPQRHYPQPHGILPDARLAITANLRRVREAIPCVCGVSRDFMRQVSNSLAGKSCPVCSSTFSLGEVITQVTYEL